MNFIEALFRISWEGLKSGLWHDKLMVFALWLPMLYSMLQDLYNLPTDFLTKAQYIIDHVGPLLQTLYLI